VSVVVTPSARETFTPRELVAAYEDYTEHGPQYLNAETSLRAAAYRFGARVLIVCEEPETGVVMLATLEEQAAAEREWGIRQCARSKKWPTWRTRSWHGRRGPVPSGPGNRSTRR
jgi:hypothetical protein